MELTYSPNDGEGLLVDLCVVLLRRRQRPRGECDWATDAIGEDVRHDCADAVWRGITVEAQR